MLLRRVRIENVRSFLDAAELRLDGPVSIIIGPNGGGKTNLLDTVVTMLRRFLLNRSYAVNAPNPTSPDQMMFQHNELLNQMSLDRHMDGATRDQVVEVELEVTSPDIEAISKIQSDAETLIAASAARYRNIQQTFANVENWNVNVLTKGQRITFQLSGNQIKHDGSEAAKLYQEFLEKFEIDSALRSESGFEALRRPLLYLPVNRAVQGLSMRTMLANFRPWEQHRQNDAANSRNPNSGIVAEAIGSIALRYRLLQEQDNTSAKEALMTDPALVELSRVLGKLGYSWSLETISAERNEYDLRLKKQGLSFLASAASSGERELLTYLLGIYALNIRDALIIVDEPELHLHPKWQKVLLDVFVELSDQTGNQFLLATHSPTFVSPDSLQYVSRVYSEKQKSNIISLQLSSLPSKKHLFSCITSQNNERVFFADAVVLVEGLSDRMVFEELLARRTKKSPVQGSIEVVSVGGKHMFEAYQKLLDASAVQYFVVADLDYVEQVGSDNVRTLFAVDEDKIKRGVLLDQHSLDGAAMIRMIDSALETGNWDDARDLWGYVKARHLRLRHDLSSDDQKTLDEFIAEKADAGTFILSKGTIESYLPFGYRGKRIDKLIDLLAKSDLIEVLPLEANELHRIVECVIERVEDRAGRDINSGRSTTESAYDSGMLKQLG